MYNTQSFVLGVNPKVKQQADPGPQFGKFRHWQAQSCTEVAVESRSMSHSPGLMVPAFWQIAPLGAGRAALTAQEGAVVGEGMMVEEVFPPLGLSLVLEAFVSGDSSVSEGSVSLEDAFEVAIVVGTLMVTFQI